MSNSLTPERRAEMQRIFDNSVARWIPSIAMAFNELLAEIARLNELLSSRSELAATTIAGLEMENARLRAECDTLRAALHHREGKAEAGRLESDA